MQLLKRLMLIILAISAAPVGILSRRKKMPREGMKFRIVDFGFRIFLLLNPPPTPPGRGAF